MGAINKYELGMKEIGISFNQYKVLGIGDSGYGRRGRSTGTEREYDYQVLSFNSCDEMIAQIKRGISQYGWEHKGYRLRDYTNGQNTWAHGQLKTYDKTLEYLTEGKVLDSVMEKATKVYEELTNNPTIEDLMQRATTFKRKRIFSEDGSDLCIDRVLCGDPFHWAKSTKGRKNTLVKIGVNLAGNCMEDETLFNNLCAVTGVVADLLTRAGFAVEITACCTVYRVTDYGGFHTTQVTLKKAEEALDLQRIYSVGCSGFFRCWIFQAWCNCLKGQPSGGLGQVRPVNKHMQEVLGIDYVIDSEFIRAESKLIKIENLFENLIQH